MTEAITTPSPDICVECGKGLKMGPDWVRFYDGDKVKFQRIHIEQWFRVGDETGPLCRACAYGEEVEG
jgi:hypothetical protein